MPRAASDCLTVIALVTLMAAACAYGDYRSTANSSLESYEMLEDEGSPEGGASSWRSHRENQMLLRKEGGKEGLPVDCCPSTLEMIEPIGGINQDGLYVVLFSEGKSKQRFYELSCREGVENRPCRFMDKRLHNQSRCVQKYSYTYAIVQRPMLVAAEDIGAGRERQGLPFAAAGTNWMLDYIRVRAGCSCEVTPRTKRKRAGSKTSFAGFRGNRTSRRDD